VRRSGFLRWGTRPPTPLIVDFIDAQHAKGRAVESVCAVLREQGVQIAARTYRAMKQRAISDRDLEDAIVVNELMKTVDEPEGLNGRRKMVAHLRRGGMDVSKRRVDRLT